MTTQRTHSRLQQPPLPLHYARESPTLFCRLGDVSIAHRDLGDATEMPVLLIMGADDILV